MRCSDEWGADIACFACVLVHGCLHVQPSFPVFFVLLRVGVMRGRESIDVVMVGLSTTSVHPNELLVRARLSSRPPVVIEVVRLSHGASLRAVY